MKTYQVKCKKGHTAIFDKGDYSDFCMCGEKYERTDSRLLEMRLSRRSRKKL